MDSWRPFELHYKAWVTEPAWFWARKEDGVQGGGKRRGVDKARILVPLDSAGEDQYVVEKYE